jgi:phage-related protein
MGKIQKVPVVFYKTAAGVVVVREWIRSLPEADRNIIGRDLMRVQYRWPVGMPLCRPLGGGLWEVRSDLPSSRIARLLFCFNKGRLVVLHGFIKKTKKAPADEMEIARKRKDELTS